MGFCDENSYLFTGIGDSASGSEFLYLFTGNGNDADYSLVDSYFFTGEGNTADFCGDKTSSSFDGIARILVLNSVKYTIRVYPEEDTMDFNTIDFQIKQGALFPSIDAVAMDADDNPLNLSGAQSVIFAFRSLRDMQVHTGQAVMVDSSTGHLRYNWATGDTEVYGMMEAQFNVIYANGMQKFPTDRYLNINVSPSLV